jgi:hypothetical protein
MADRLLVLLMDPRRERSREVRKLVSGRRGGPPEVHVVVPAQVSALEWFASAEDAARDEATRRAQDARSTVAPVAAEHTAEAGDVDPVVAVEDALQTFRADEIVVVDAPEGDGSLDSDLERFGPPITHVDGTVSDRDADSARSTARAIASGRSGATPVVLFVATMVTVLAVAGLIALVAWLVVSLA